MNTETRALALLARMIGRQHGVDVVFSESVSTAATDKKRIYLPIIANIGTEDHAALIEGMVDHEAAHCRFTDFDAAVGCSTMVKRLTNILEDVRIELLQARIYPGCAVNIRKALQVMTTLGMFRGFDASKPVSMPAAFMNFLLLDLRAKVNQVECFRDFAQSYREVLEPVVGLEAFDRIQAVSHQVFAAQSTKDALVIAQEIVELLREAADQLSSQRQQDQQGEKGQSQGNSAESDSSGPPQQSGSSGNSGTSQQDPGDPGNGQGDPGQSGDPNQASGSPQHQGGSQQGQSQDDGDPGQSDDPDQSGQAGVTSSGDDEDNVDANEARQKAIEDIVNAQGDDIQTGELADAILDALRNGQKAGSDLDSDETSHARTMRNGAASGCAFAERQPVDFSAMQAFFQAHQMAAVEMSRPISIKLGNKLEELLETRTDTFEVRKRQGRKVATRRITNVALGKLDIFRSMQEEDRPDTVVLKMLDLSGSMFYTFDGRRHVNDEGKSMSGLSPNEIRVQSLIKPESTRVTSALAVAYAAAQVLDKHDIAFGLYGFGDGLMPIKTFDERWASCRHRRGMTVELGGTQTDCALLKLIELLALRDEKRKVGALVTDGCPDNEDSLIAVMLEARRRGIEFALLFIGDEGRPLEAKLKSLGYQVARAKSSDELAASFFDAVESAI